KRNRATLGDDLERAEDSKLHRPSRRDATSAPARRLARDATRHGRAVPGPWTAPTSLPAVSTTDLEASMHPDTNTRRPLLALSAAAAGVACGALAGSASADPWWQQGSPRQPIERATSAGPAFAPFVVSPDQQDRRRAASATSAAPSTIHVLSVARSQRPTI